MASNLTGWQNQENPGLDQIYMFDSNKLSPQAKFKQIDFGNSTKNQTQKINRSKFLIACPKKHSKSKEKVYKKQNLHLLTIGPCYRRKTSLDETKLKISKKVIINKQKVIQQFEKKKASTSNKIANNLSSQIKKCPIISVFEKIQIKTPQVQHYFDTIKQKSQERKIQKSLSKLLREIQKNKIRSNKNVKFKKFTPQNEIHKSVSYTNLLTYSPVRYEILPLKSTFLLKRSRKTTSEYSLLKKPHNRQFMV